MIVNRRPSFKKEQELVTFNCNSRRSGCKLNVPEVSPIKEGQNDMSFDNTNIENAI